MDQVKDLQPLPKGVFNFLQPPREIRDMIYECLVEKSFMSWVSISDSGDGLPGPRLTGFRLPFPNFYLASRQIYVESTTIALKKSAIAIRSQEDSIGLLRILNSANGDVIARRIKCMYITGGAWSHDPNHVRYLREILSRCSNIYYMKTDIVSAPLFECNSTQLRCPEDIFEEIDLSALALCTNLKTLEITWLGLAGHEATRNKNPKRVIQPLVQWLQNNICVNATVESIPVFHWTSFGMGLKL